MMNFSTYQTAVFNHLADASNGSCVINAVAGSGKTTTIVEAAKRASKQGFKVLFLAFNKSIASELAKRMVGTNVECKTLHSHGFAAVLKGSGKRIKVDERKWTNYIKSNLPTLSTFESDNNIEIFNFCRTAAELLNLCRINLVKHGETERISEIAIHHGIDVKHDEESVVNTLLGICYNMDEIIDYTDMITLPCMTASVKRNVPQYDLVFVDECQDLNAAQQKLLTLSIKKGGRFCAVGDPRQAINGFCGADIESFKNLVGMASGKELPLSVCYRCGSDIIAEAQQIVPNILPFEGAASGEIEHRTDLNGIALGDMVICRKAAPLVGLCLKLIANGMSAKVKGKDIAEGLKKLIKKLEPKDTIDLFIKLDDELIKIQERLAEHGIVGKAAEKAPSVVTFKDKLECLKIIAENAKSVADIDRKLDELFSDYTSGRMVTLSTIHKAKGLEADNVHIVVPNKLPLTFDGQQAWELEQEYNLKYVAITRAKKHLTYIDLDENELQAYKFEL